MTAYELIQKYPLEAGMIITAICLVLAGLVGVMYMLLQGNDHIDDIHNLY